MDEPSAQLASDLRSATVQALSTRRPLIHHLSADTAWLLQIPRPSTATKRGGRFYFNILIDPWLSGDQIDIFKWVSRQWHAEEPRFGSIAAVEELLREIEILTVGLRLGKGRRSSLDEIEEHGEVETFIDAVAICHEFTDHCHQQTLLQVHPDVPVFATEKAASLIRSWSHFRIVETIPRFTADNLDWRSSSILPLPEWIGISRFMSHLDPSTLHSGLLITFNNNLHNPSNSSDDEESAEAIIYTPHGIYNHELALIPTASPPIRTLALLHGLQEVYIGRFGSQINLGAHNGLKAQRMLNAKYWIGTHDEVKHGAGIVGWLLQRNYLTVKDALQVELERKKKEGKGEVDANDEVLDSFRDAHWVDLKNGESRVLI